MDHEEIVLQELEKWDVLIDQMNEEVKELERWITKAGSTYEFVARAQEIRRTDAHV